MKKAETSTFIYHHRVDNRLIRSRKKRRKDATVVAIVLKNTISFGVASCSHMDMYNKKEGRKLAKERAETNPFLVIHDSEISNIKQGIKYLLIGIASDANNLVQEHYANKHSKQRKSTESTV